MSAMELENFRILTEYHTDAGGVALVGSALNGNSHLVEILLEHGPRARVCSTAWVEALQEGRQGILSMLKPHTHAVWIIDALMQKDPHLFDVSVEKDLKQVVWEHHSGIVLKEIHAGTDHLSKLASMVLQNDCDGVRKSLATNSYDEEDIAVAFRLALNNTGPMVDCFANVHFEWNARTVVTAAQTHPLVLKNYDIPQAAVAEAVLLCFKRSDMACAVKIVALGVNEVLLKGLSHDWHRHEKLWDECVALHLNATLTEHVGEAQAVRARKI